MQIDAIVTDLDDTLLNEESRLSDYTVGVLRQATARGLRVIPASGRAAYSMLQYVKALETGQPYIACNGAQLINADHTVRESRFLSPETGRALIRYFQAMGFYVQCYRDEHFYFAQGCEASENYRRSSGMRGFAVGDLASFLDFPTPKVLSVAAPEDVAALYPVMQPAFPDVTLTISKPFYLEAQPQGVTKGTALRALASQIGLSPERTLVFGDSLNDLDMLGFAVHSVAVGNARDEVKQAARHMCATNGEDGVARFIEEHVLQADSVGHGRERP